MNKIQIPFYSKLGDKKIFGDRGRHIHHVAIPEYNFNPKMYFCGKCDSIVNEEDKYCRSCGIEFTGLEIRAGD